MARSACLIFNPASGQGDPDQDLQRIEQLLTPSISLDVRSTTEAVGADLLAQEALEQGFKHIIVSGGDGTLSAVAGVLSGTGIALGIIPRGTANAFAAALGLPNTIDEACQVIVSGTEKVIDLALCNGKPMILLAGIGFESETIDGADRQSKDRLGILAYLLSGIEQLTRLQFFEAEIETEEKIIRFSAAAITIANAAPPTSFLAQGPDRVIYDDGLLDITIIAPNNLVNAVAASYHLLQTASRDQAVERDDIGYLRAKRVKVTTQPEQQVVLDGEMIGTTPIEVESIPGGLTILVPGSPDIKPLEKLAGLPDLEIELK